MMFLETEGEAPRKEPFESHQLILTHSIPIEPSTFA
jgi:hypothetical protein